MRRRYRPRDNSPRELTARFDSVCAETGKTIRKGDKCFWFPSSRKVYCVDSKTVRDFHNALEDERLYTATYGTSY